MRIIFLNSLYTSSLYYSLYVAFYKISDMKIHWLEVCTNLRSQTSSSPANSISVEVIVQPLPHRNTVMCRRVILLIRHIVCDVFRASSSITPNIPTLKYLS